MSIEERVREAELAFLNAPFQPDGWMAAIQLLAAATGSAVAQLCGGSAGSSSLSFNYFSADCHDPHGHLHNPLVYGAENWRINTTTAARTIQYEHHYAAYRAAHRSEFYDDAVSDLDLPFGCQSALLLDQNGMAGLALLRSSRDGPCSPETLSRFATIARQAHRAMRVQLALGEQAAELMVAAPSGQSEMTIVIDSHANVLAMTDAAEALFDQPDALSLAGHRLRFANPVEDRAVQHSFARLLASDGISGPVVHEAKVGRHSTAPDGRWRLVVVRLSPDGAGFGYEPRLALTFVPL